MYAKVRKSLPEMYAFTVCMWLKSSAAPGVGTPFSYAVPGQANELVLIEWGNNPMEILINDKVRPRPRVWQAGRAMVASWRELREVSVCGRPEWGVRPHLPPLESTESWDLPHRLWDAGVTEDHRDHVAPVMMSPITQGPQQASRALSVLTSQVM